MDCDDAEARRGEEERDVAAASSIACGIDSLILE